MGEGGVRGEPIPISLGGCNVTIKRGDGSWQTGVVTYSAEGVSLTESEYFLYCKLRSIEKKVDELRWRR